MSEFLQTRPISPASKLFSLLPKPLPNGLYSYSYSSSIYFANKNSHFPLITIETLNYFKKNNASQIYSIQQLAITFLFLFLPN